MTVLGVILSGPNYVTCWADTETYREDGTIHSYASKLRINARGPFVGLGTGWADLLRQADNAVQDAADLDEATEKVPIALRKHAERVTQHRASPDFFQFNGYAVAGWSPRAGRMLAWRFTATSFFTPVLASIYASPPIEDTSTSAPTEEAVIALVRSQMRLLQETRPLAGAGDLTIATVSPAGAFIRVIRDFARPYDHIEEAA